MKLTFIVPYGGRNFTLIAQRTNLFPTFEMWCVQANNKTFYLECNRPLLAKRNLDRNPWEWKITQGVCPRDFKEPMLKALEEAVRTH